MALGFGSIQRRIARVIDCEGEVYPSELAWRFAFEDHQAPRVSAKMPDDVTLPSRAYVGVARAARQMALHGEYELRSRRLSTFEDLERFYPYRTTQLRVVYARQRLIASLIDYARRERLHVFDVGGSAAGGTPRWQGERRRILYNDRAKAALRSARPDVCAEIGEELLDTVFDRWAFEPFVFARRVAKKARTA